VDLSFTFIFVIMCVCTVTDFSAEDKASGVKFCTVVLRRLAQEISNFEELCSSEAQNRPANRHAASGRKIGMCG